MKGNSYSQGRLTGVSDGTTAGHRGADDYKASQRHLERNKHLLQGQQAGGARMHEEGRKLGELLMTIVAGLFLHPYFCFVGFWMVCFGLLLALAPHLGLSDGGLNGLPEWYGYSAAALPVIPAVLLRKLIPRLMKWIFFGALAVFAVTLVVAVVISR